MCRFIAFTLFLTPSSPFPLPPSLPLSRFLPPHSLPPHSRLTPSSLPLSLLTFRIAVFSITVLREERVVVVAEQKPNCSDEEAFTWMNSVVPAAESIHGVNLYGIVLVAAGRLPRVRD